MLHHILQIQDLLGGNHSLKIFLKLKYCNRIHASKPTLVLLLCNLIDHQYYYIYYCYVNNMHIKTTADYCQSVSCARMAGVKTRKKSGSHLSEYLGTGKELLVSELPTLRDILRYGLLVRELSENDPRNMTVKDVSKAIFDAVTSQWLKANALFKPPVIVSEKSATDKIIEAWDMATKISQNRTKKDQKERFEKKLDKLFDILSCKCQILSCSDFGCLPDCSLEAHINCSCPKVC